MNVLLTALEIQGNKPVAYYRDTGMRTTTRTGRDVTQFAPMEIIEDGYVVPVPRNLYVNLGLDLQKNYVTWFTPVAVIDLQRNFSGDQIVFSGRRYQLESETDWFDIDEWVPVICVSLGADNAG